jgi:hypothetical protein
LISFLAAAALVDRCILVFMLVPSTVNSPLPPVQCYFDAVVDVVV